MSRCKIFLLPFLFTVFLSKTHSQHTDPFDVFRGSVLSGADSIYPKNGEGSVIRLKDGRLLHMVSRHMQGTPGNTDFWPAIIAAMYSSDNGLTWSAPEVVFSHDKGVRTCMQPSLARLGNGDLGVAYSKYDSPSSAIKVFRYSGDEGKTWSAEILMSPTNGYYSGAHHRMLVLSNGRLIYPLHTKIGEDKGEPVRIFTQIAYSDDHGRSWKRSPQIVGTNDVSKEYAGSTRRAAVFAEASVAELKNGDLVMLARTIAGSLYSTVSRDKGLSWSEPVSTGLVSPASSLNLITVPQTGDLMVAWQSCCLTGEKGAGKRLSLSTAISEDGGKSWKWRRELVTVADADGDVQYPTLTVDDQKVIITYRSVKKVYQPRWVMEEQLLIYPLEWFYAEKDFNSGVLPVKK